MSNSPSPTTPSTVNFPSGKLAAVTRVRNKINDLLDDESAPTKEIVQQLHTEFLQKLENFIVACNELLKLETVDQHKLKLWYHDHMSVITDFRAKVEDYLARKVTIGNLLNFDRQSNHGSDRSNHTRSSGRSSTSSAKVRLAEKKAKLAAERNYLERTAQLEQERRQQIYVQQQEEEEIKRKQQEEEARVKRKQQEEEANYELRIKRMELDKIEQENEIFSEELDKIDGIQNTQDPREFRTASPFRIDNVIPAVHGHVNPTAEITENADLSRDRLIDVLAKQNEISMTLARSHDKASLPKKEMRIFDGKDLTLYNSFMQSFKRIIEDKCDSDADCLYYLEQYTALGPQELVKSCNQQDASVELRKAKALLQQEYGNEYKIANAYLQKLEAWAPIKNEDGESLRELSVYLMSIHNYMDNMQSLQHLNSPKEMLGILKKLPYKLKEKWRNTTLQLSEANKQITFKNLVDFVHRQAALLNQPLFGDILKDNLTTERQNKWSPKISTNKSKSFHTKVNQPSKFEASMERKACPCCRKDNHTLDYCKFFAMKTAAERSEFVKKNGFCFGCLRSDHRSRGCTNRLTCRICSRKHPTCLHDDNKVKTLESSKEPPVVKPTEPIQSTTLMQTIENPVTTTDQTENNHSTVFCTKSIQTSHHTGASDKKIACPMIPIRMSVQGHTNYILTYAALDSFSSDCFLNEKLLKQLGMKGHDTSIYLTTMENKRNKIRTKVLNDLQLSDIDGNESVILPVVYAKTAWPFTRQDVPNPTDVLDFPQLKTIPFRYIEDSDVEVGILIGMNHPNILKPIQVVDAQKNGTYASQHLLGWAVNGPIDAKCNLRKICHNMKVERKPELEIQIEKMYSRDFTDCQIDQLGPSVDDIEWEQRVQSSIKLLPDGHYEIELPFKEKPVSFPYNRTQVYKHFEAQRRRLKKDSNYCSDYQDFMNMMQQNQFMEKVPENEIKTNPGQVWFLSHHGIYHKAKKKIRVVFNCSLAYMGVSLNDKLLQGPDLTSNLLGVLLRFRQGHIAFMGDIVKMFYQVKVPTKHANFMRFFWFPDGNMSEEPIEYRLTRHVFGATSSPSVANFALRRTVVDACGVDLEIAKTVERNFYVDDLLKSLDNEGEAIQHLKKVQDLVSVGSFHLTGFVSNSRMVLNSVSPDDLAGNLKNLDLSLEKLPFNRALGLIWNAEKDTLSFKINVSEQPLTRRGILATIFGIYDPLGISGPAIIVAKKLFQETCRLKLQWDEELPMDLINQWKSWLEELPLLANYQVPRCYKPTGIVRHTEIHIFCDGSEIAYGIVAYIRFVYGTSEIYCLPIMAKARLTPLNNTALKTIPRIELNAARLAITVQQILHRELDLKIDNEYFWSDSTTVLNYISNDTKRFQRFVANRVTTIRMYTTKEQWNYVPTDENPADLISRGVSIARFMKSEKWRHGPRFLWQNEENWPKSPKCNEISEFDPETKKESIVIATRLHDRNATNQLLESSSCWYGVKCKVAWMLRFKHGLRSKDWSSLPMSVSDLKLAELAIWKYVQSVEYATTVDSMQNGKLLQKNNKLLKLCPFIDSTGLLRVGGRLNRSVATYSVKHPIILPSDSHVVLLLVRHTHRLVGHLGRESVMSQLRQKYWIIGLNSLTRKVLRDCVQCRKRQSKPSEQMMADLPEDRVTSDLPAFASTGVDFFGPFLVKRGRKSEKRYGVIFTCVASRAMHLEIAHSLDTSSFICALRRFVSRRGNVKKMRSDNGTNLVAGNRELKQAIAQWNVNAIENWMKQNEINWKFQPPAASHFGGVWEREIRCVRRVLSALMNEQPLRLSDEEFSTLMCEVESILNSRPLTEISGDPNDLEAITPNHLLLLHSEVTFPPGLFNKDDLYSRKRWKQVQYLADLFWTRWRKEYLPLLQSRQKWTKDQDSHRIGDLVLIMDHILPRNQWPVGRINQVFKDEHGRVRSARIRIAKYKDGSKSRFGTIELERPIVKLILLKSVESL